MVEKLWGERMEDLEVGQTIMNEHADGRITVGFKTAICSDMYTVMPLGSRFAGYQLVQVNHKVSEILPGNVALLVSMVFKRNS